jgi:hypothetical protein
MAPYEGCEEELDEGCYEGEEEAEGNELEEPQPKKHIPVKGEGWTPGCYDHLPPEIRNNLQQPVQSKPFRLEDLEKQE